VYTNLLLELVEASVGDCESSVSFNITSFPSSENTNLLNRYYSVFKYLTFDFFISNLTIYLI
jgi:hypothetical protein